MTRKEAPSAPITGPIATPPHLEMESHLLRLSVDTTLSQRNGPAVGEGRRKEVASACRQVVNQYSKEPNVTSSQIHPGSLIQRLKATPNSLATLYNNMYYDPVPQAPGDYLGYRGLGRASPNARNAEGK